MDVCIQKSASITEAKKRLFGSENCFDCFYICSSTILHLARKFRVGHRTLIHALVMSQNFIVLSGSDGHQIVCQGCPPTSFWVCISMICFSVSVSFHEIYFVRLEDMIACMCDNVVKLRITYSKYTKMFYKRVQQKFLMLTQWSLYFPTAIDFIDFIKLKASMKDDPINNFVSNDVQDNALYCILSHSYLDWDMLDYSCHSMAVAAIITVIRQKSMLYHGNDGLVEALSIYEADSKEVAECAELMYRKVTASLSRKNRA